jgi:hypothetical protein
MTAKEKGVGVLTIHQSFDMGEGEDQDSQWGHIISPDWVSHLPADHSCNNQEQLFFDCERQIKPSVSFPGDTGPFKLQDIGT